MRYILLLFLVAIVSTLQAQHNFTNGSVSFYTDHTALSNQQESVDFMLMGSCEVSGTLRYRWVNRNGTDYEGPNWFEWNEDECHITINDTYGEPSTLQIEISGKCDCIGDDEASRLSTFEFSGKGKPNWVSSPQEMYGDAKPNMSIDQCIGTFKEDFSGLSEEELMRMNIEVPGQIKIERINGLSCNHMFIRHPREV